MSGGGSDIDQFFCVGDLVKEDIGKAIVLDFADIEDVTGEIGDEASFRDEVFEVFLAGLKEDIFECDTAFGAEVEIDPGAEEAEEDTESDDRMYE